MKRQIIFIILGMFIAAGASAQNKIFKAITPKVQQFFGEQVFGEQAQWSSKDYREDPFIDETDALIFNFDVSSELIQWGDCFPKGEELNLFAKKVFKKYPKIEYIELIAQKTRSTGVFYMHREDSRRAITITQKNSGEVISFIQDPKYIQVTIKTNGSNKGEYYLDREKDNGEIIIVGSIYAIRGELTEGIMKEKTQNKTLSNYEELESLLINILK